MPESNEQNTVNEIYVDTSKLEEQNGQIIEKVTEVSDKTTGIQDNQNNHSEILNSIKDSNESIKTNFETFLEDLELERETLQEQDEQNEQSVIQAEEVDADRWESLDENLKEIIEKMNESNEAITSISTNELEQSMVTFTESLDSFNDIYEVSFIGLGLILGCFVAQAFIRGVQP